MPMLFCTPGWVARTCTYVARGTCLRLTLLAGLGGTPIHPSAPRTLLGRVLVVEVVVLTEMPGSRMRRAARVIRQQSDRQPPRTLSIQTSCDESRSHRRAVQARVDQPCCSSCATSASADCGSFLGARPASLEDSLPQSPYMPLVEAPVDAPVQAHDLRSVHVDAPSRTLPPSSVPNLSFDSGAHSSQLPRGSWERPQQKIARSLAAPQCADCGCGATIVTARSKGTRQAQQASGPEFL